MSTSTDGIICYGIQYKDGHDFPWDAQPWDGDVEQWWRDVNGYRPPFQLYSDEGGYVPGIETVQDRYGGIQATQSVIDAYYDPMIAWKKANPLPIELVNYCSCDCPMYILAVTGSGLSNSRGYPEAFDPSTLTTPDASQLLAFCERFSIEVPSGPKWYLCSYWG